MIEVKNEASLVESAIGLTMAHRNQDALSGQLFAAMGFFSGDLGVSELRETAIVSARLAYNTVATRVRERTFDLHVRRSGGDFPEFRSPVMGANFVLSHLTEITESLR